MKKIRRTASWKPIVLGGVPLGETNSDFTYDSLVNIVVGLVEIILQLGAIAAVAAVIWYGLQMVLARGDAGKYSAAKKSLGLALVGAVIIFGVYTIIATIQAGVKSVGR